MNSEMANCAGYLHIEGSKVIAKCLCDIIPVLCIFGHSCCWSGDIADKAVMCKGAKVLLQVTFNISDLPCWNGRTVMSSVCQ